MLAAAALGWGPRRSLNLIAAGVTTATYAVYVAVVAANGEFSTWWQSKTTGARRLLGLVQITGFNHRGAPSLVSRLGSEALYFGTTYALLILAIPAMVLLLRRDGLPRMLGLLYLAAAAALGYAVTLGTLEENELYLLLVPSLLILPVAAALWRGGLGVRRWDDARERRRKLGTAVAAVALAAVLAVNLGACVVWLLRPDDGYAQLRAYMTAHVPAGAGVASVDDSPPLTLGTTHWALGDRYRVGAWVTPAARSREHVRYVVVPWMEVDQGYSYLTPAKARSLVRNGKLLFSFRGRTYGDLALYQIPPAG